MTINSQLNGFVENAAGAMNLALTWRLADQPLNNRFLTEGEQQRVYEFSLAQRRNSWLLGRSALKPLLSKMGMDTDTSTLSLPHPNLSLSHSGNLALAIGCSGKTRGIGIDLELRASPRLQTARMFLTETELEQWVTAPEMLQGPLLLKLWCIKEAAFKANLNNHATHIFDYEVHDMFANCGTVRFDRTTTDGQFISMPLNSSEGRGCVAFAIYS